MCFLRNRLEKKFKFNAETDGRIPFFSNFDLNSEIESQELIMIITQK